MEPRSPDISGARASGCIIWSTDIAESSETTGGGKSKPSTTTYSYSCSFAVALASRPIQSVGRIWADGNLLRGAAGDLKVGGELRVYLGHADQEPDPLIASDKGSDTPAFRGLSYVVFESLQLANFGNRIPALSFEVIADNSEVTLAEIMPELDHAIEIDRPLSSLAGISEEGGPLIASLENISRLYPLSCNADGEKLGIISSDIIPAYPALLPEAVSDPSRESFGKGSGKTSRRQAEPGDIPEGLRYYDMSRDFQLGLQRANGRARSGRSQVIEFPGTFQADDARYLANQAAERSAWAKESLSWRMAELDPAIGPGKIVRVPGKPGFWLIESWEWRDTGIELDLLRIPHGVAHSPAGDAGASLPKPDLLATPTQLRAVELPWDGQGSSSQRQVFAAASSVSAGWTGAALYIDQGGALEPVGHSGSRRSVIGQLTQVLTPAAPHLVDRHAILEVEIASEDFALFNATPGGLANGANRVIVGAELLQFISAAPVAGSVWQLRGLLRGRGGSEAQCQSPHPVGTHFLLLDDTPKLIDATKLGQAVSLAATGLADADPVLATIMDVGRTLKPLAPVHPSAEWLTDGSLDLRWTRRARGAWEWPDLVDAPLVEQAESYVIGVGNPDSPSLYWQATAPSLTIDVVNMATLQSSHAGQPIWVRQIGSHSASDPLLLHTIS